MLMTFLMLIAIATLSEEASADMGKRALKRHKESLFTLGFLSVIWSFAFYVVSIQLGAPFKLDLSHWPNLLLHVVLELAEAQVAITALAKTDRSTYGFFRLIVIGARRPTL